MRWLITVLGIVFAVGALVAIKGARIGMLIGFGKQAEKDGPPPEAVATAVAEEQSWEGTLTSVGSVASAKGVALAADAAGVVTRISFESGETVKQGQVLVRARRERRARAARVGAGRAKDLADHHDRAHPCARRRREAIAQSQLDADEAQLRTATDRRRGPLRRRSRRKTDPRTVRRQARHPLGEPRAVPATRARPVTVLETIDAVYVDFSLPQQRLARHRGRACRCASPSRATDAPPLDGTIAADRPDRRRDDAHDQASRERPEQDGEPPPGHVRRRSSVVLPEKRDVRHRPRDRDRARAVRRLGLRHRGAQAETPGIAKTPDGKPVKVARQQFVARGRARAATSSPLLDGVKASEEVVTRRRLQAPQRRAGRGRQHEAARCRSSTPNPRQSLRPR